ncbi:MAG: peptidylprolyl isomerase [Nostoc sp. NMS1]|uniref:peptidylprolyl isomerase n=1 Tax=unclassified Nostoc TaxID=2593658 RepID=UPI0025DFC7E5|nr:MULTISPECIES: peptidylprolyl isomerase [unclassified Nostoc]MBN3905573.1 peptidylprolyl isomerase [Nostoc sp. NMS1]MBN3992457.1 peptidylprolyl isomerase [Nostoc sp. NMS2]
MSEFIVVSPKDIIYQIKLSCQFPTIVEGIIGRKIIIDAAQEAGIKVDTEELQEAADSLRMMNKLENAEATWSWLQKHDLSLDDLEELVYYNVLSSKLAEHLFADKVEQFFVEHHFDYAQVVMYEVVFDDLDLAMEMFYAIQEDEISFPEVARQYIQNDEIRRCGGYKGILSRINLKPEISTAVFAATPPQLLKPIVSSQGVHLINVEEIITPKLNKTLYLKIISHLFSEWMKQQCEEIKFEFEDV